MMALSQNEMPVREIPIGGMEIFMSVKIRKIVSCLLLCGILLPVYSALARQEDITIRVSYNNVKVFVDDERTVLTDALGNPVEPFIYEGTTYLPLRAVAETLSTEVSWDGDNYIVDLKSGSGKADKKEISYTPYVGVLDINISYRDISVFLDGEKLELMTADGNPAEPFIYEGTTYLPLRAVAEATNTQVEWDADTNSIYLSTSGEEQDIKYESSYDLGKQSDWSAQEAQNYGYTLDFESKAEDGYVVLLEYNGDETDVLVPSKIDAKTVYINYDSNYKLFRDNTHIQYVSFEDGVYIQSALNLFLGCSELRGVYNCLPRGSGANMFNGCKKLEVIDADFSKINDMKQAYVNCYLTKNVPIIGSLVTNVDKAFLNCDKLGGDIHCESTGIISAEDTFSGTAEKINLYVPYPSQSYSTFEASELPENVTLIKVGNRIAFLPKQINIATNTTVEIYNSSVAPEFADCDFNWECEIGKASSDRYTIIADDGMEGEYARSVTVLRDGETIYTADSTVYVVSGKDMTKSMNIVCIGDSYAARSEWKIRVGRYTQRVKFVGTRASEHEGRTNLYANDYLKQFNYTGDKNGVGVVNPFFNTETQTFDWEYYKEYSGLSPSGVQIFFQNLGRGTVSDNVDYIKTMVEAIRKSSPDMKIFIVIPANLANWNEDKVSNNFEYAKFLDDEFSDTENTYLIPLNITYNRANFNPNNRMLPNEAGYNQWGDVIYGAYAAALQ